VSTRRTRSFLLKKKSLPTLGLGEAFGTARRIQKDRRSKRKQTHQSAERCIIGEKGGTDPSAPKLSQQKNQKRTCVLSKIQCEKITYQERGWQTSARSKLKLSVLPGRTGGKSKKEVCRRGYRSGSARDTGREERDESAECRLSSTDGGKGG